MFSADQPRFIIGVSNWSHILHCLNLDTMSFVRRRKNNALHKVGPASLAMPSPFDLFRATWHTRNWKKLERTLQQLPYRTRRDGPVSERSPPWETEEEREREGEGERGECRSNSLEILSYQTIFALQLDSGKKLRVNLSKGLPTGPKQIQSFPPHTNSSLLLLLANAAVDVFSSFFQGPRFQLRPRPQPQHLLFKLPRPERGTGDARDDAL